jgi:hypothetical protein
VGSCLCDTCNVCGNEVITEKEVELNELEKSNNTQYKNKWGMITKCLLCTNWIKETEIKD